MELAKRDLDTIDIHPDSIPPHQLTDRLFKKQIIIGATPRHVWAALTQPDLMKQWMAETPLEIETSWEVGTSIVIRGNEYWAPFENRGVVLAFETERQLRYSHLSSLSRLADKIENYSVIDFELSPSDEETRLTLSVTGFPTESIYKHLVFYWETTFLVLKRFVEG